MAERIYSGATDGILNKTVNWDAAVADGDSLVFPSSANTTQNVTGGDYTGTAENWVDYNFDNIEVREGCALTFGTISAAGVMTPVQLDMTGESNKLVTMKGTGVGYWDITAAARVDIYNSGTSTSQTGQLTKPGMDLRGTCTAVNINVPTDKTVGLSWFEDVAGSFTDLTTTNLGITTGNVYVGDSATMTNLNMWNGVLHGYSGFSGTMTLHGGTLFLYEGAHGTIYQYGGRIVYIGNGTITTLYGYGGSIDFDQGEGAVPVTNPVEARAGYRINNAKGRVTQDVKSDSCSQHEVTHVTPVNKTSTLS